MKIEINLTPEDIEAIACRVYEKLKPLFEGKQTLKEDRLLTVAELAKYLGVSKQWIYNNKKKLNPEYLNKRPLFRLSTVDAILKQKAIKKDDSLPKPLKFDTTLKARTFNYQR